MSPTPFVSSHDPAISSHLSPDATIHHPDSVGGMNPAEVGGLASKTLPEDGGTSGGVSLKGGVPGESFSTSTLRPSRIRHEALWLVSGQFALALSQWAMLAMGAKTMGPEMLGRWGLAAAVVSPIAIFGSLNLRGLLATDTKHQWAMADYFQLRLLGSVFSGVLVLLIAPLVSRDPVVWACMALVTLQRTVEGASEMQYGALQRAHHNRIIGQSFLGRSVISLIAFGVILYSTHSLVWALTAQTLAGIIMYWSFDRGQSIQLGVRPQTMTMEWPRTRQAWKEWYAVRRPLLMEQALPYSWLGLTPALMAAAPRWVLGGADVAALGYFTALIYGPTAMSLVAGSLGQTIQPRLASAWHENNVKGIVTLLQRAVITMAFLGAMAVLTVVAVGDIALTHLYRPDYAMYSNLLAWMTVGGACQMIGSMAGVSLTAWRRVSDQKRNACFLVGLNFLLAVVLVPHWKFAGAVAAVVVTNVVHMISSWFLVSRALLVCRQRAGTSAASV